MLPGLAAPGLLTRGRKGADQDSFTGSRSSFFPQCFAGFHQVHPRVRAWPGGGGGRAKKGRRRDRRVGSGARGGRCRLAGRAGPGSGSRCGISCPARRPSCRPPPGLALRFRPPLPRPHPRPPAPAPRLMEGAGSRGAGPARRQGARGLGLLLLLWLLPGLAAPQDLNPRGRNVCRTPG